MLTWITHKDPSTHALVRRAAELCMEEDEACFDDKKIILLAIIEIEGTDDLVIQAEFDTEPFDEEYVMGQAQYFVEESRKRLRQFYPLSLSFFFTFAQYDQETGTYVKAMVDGVFAQRD